MSALVSLHWDWLDLRHGLLHVARRKDGVPFHHPVRGPELQALRRLQQDEPEPARCSSVSAWRRSRPRPYSTSSAEPDERPASAYRFTCTCRATPPATSRPTMGRTPGLTESGPPQHPTPPLYPTGSSPLQDFLARLTGPPTHHGKGDAAPVDARRGVEIAPSDVRGPIGPTNG